MMLPIKIWDGHELREHGGHLNAGFAYGGFKTVIDTVEFVSCGVFKKGADEPFVLLAKKSLFPAENWNNCVWAGAQKRKLMGEEGMSDKQDLGNNDLGVPALAHYELLGPCPQSQPGDWSMDEVDEVTCPVCLKEFDKMRKQRQRLMNNGKN